MAFDDVFGEEDFTLDPEDLRSDHNESDAWDTGSIPDIFASGERQDIFASGERQDIFSPRDA